VRSAMSRFFLGAVLVCAGLAGGTASAVEFKIATVAPEGSGWMRSLRAAAEEIEQATDGRAGIKYYAGGIMGNEKKVLRKIRIGQLQGGVFTANGLSERYADIVIYGLPLMFNSEAEAAWVRERIDPILSAGLNDAGFVSFGFASGGFAKIMGAQPVTSLDQLRGKKIWVPEGDQISYSAMEALELAPVVLPITDVLTGLQTGLLEFIATPPVGAVILQWYTKVSYVTELPVSYTIGTMAIDKRAFSRLGEADQRVFRDVMERTYREAEEQTARDNADAQQALVDNGLKLVRPDADAVAGMRRRVASTYEDMAAEGVFSAELFRQLQAHLHEYRNGDTGPRQVATGTEE